jgi:uncharacterized membrane protein
MDKSSVLLAVAIFMLFTAYFTGFFILPLYTVILNLLGLISAILFLLAYYYRDQKLKSNIKINKYVIAVIVLLFVLLIFNLSAIVTIALIAALLFVKYISEKVPKWKLYLVMFLLLILLTALGSLVLYNRLAPTPNTLKPSDEAAFNYYAAYLSLHGSNPYTSSMQPILTQFVKYNQTYYLNGTVMTQYNYPALSFLPLILLQILNPNNINLLLIVIIFIYLLVAFLVYVKSKYNNFALIPIAAWFIVSCIYPATIIQYFGISILLVLAYTERKNAVLCGLLLGLSASTTQLCWFAIPFFLILIFKENGKKALAISILVMLLVVFAINTYFIILAPKKFFGDVLTIFGTSSLVPGGTNLAQVLLQSYPVQMWYPAILSIVVLLLSLIIFYFYTSTAKPLIFLAPAFIFFLSWRNAPYYGLSFVPLIIVMCYESRKENLQDLIKKKSYIYLYVAIVVIFAVILAIYAHHIYIKENILSISAKPLIQISNNSRNLNSVTLNITNNGNKYEDMVVLLATINPNNDSILTPFTSQPIIGVAPHSKNTYMLKFVVRNITNNTDFYIVVYSKDYIVSKTILKGTYEK